MRIKKPLCLRPVYSLGQRGARFLQLFYIVMLQSKINADEEGVGVVIEEIIA